MKFALAIVLVSSLFVVGNALVCWRCDNARTNKECKRNGRLQTCQRNEGSCYNEVRRENSGLRITKRCKQTNACQNNERNAGESCPIPRLNAVCRCCCNFDQCNVGLGCRQTAPPRERPTRPKQTPGRVTNCFPIPAPKFGLKRCTKRPETKVGSVCRFKCNRGFKLVGKKRSRCVYNRISNTAVFNQELPICRRLNCPDLGELEHGRISCRKGNRIGSRCSFRCLEEGYEIFPPDWNNNVCLKGGVWSLTKPCCLRECPMFAVVDLIVVMDSSSSIGSENWATMKSFVLNLTNAFTIGPDFAQVAVLRYNDAVDTSTQILLNSVEDKASFISAYERIPYNGDGTNTGQALKHVQHQILQDINGNRRGAIDVVVVITDGKSQDTLDIVAEDLRDENVVTFAVGINPPRGAGLNHTQLLQIAGSPSNVLTAGDFSELNEQLSQRLSSAICTNQCVVDFRNDI